MEEDPPKNSANRFDMEPFLGYVSFSGVNAPMGGHPRGSKK